MTRSTKARRGERLTAEAASTSVPLAAPPAAPAPVPAAPATPGTLAGLPPLYTLREVARNLNVSRSTIWRMTKAGAVPYMRVGKQIRFDLLAVRAAIDRHR